MKAIRPVLMALLAASGLMASAEPVPKANDITRRVIEENPIEGTNKVLQLILVEYAPGVAGQPHLHPAVGLNYILAGEAESQYENEPIKRFKAGETYQDPAGKPHLIFRNASATEPLKFLIAVELEKGQSFAQPLPKTADVRQGG